MKITFIAIVLLFSTLFCEAQVETKITIWIKNSPNNLIQLVFLNHTKIDSTMKIRPTKNGNYVISFTNENSFDVTLYDLLKNKIPLRVNPNDNLSIVYDIENMESTIKISGKGAEKNIYLFEKSYEDMVFKGLGMSEKIKTLNFDEFQKHRKELFSAESEMLGKYKSSLDKEFYKSEKEKINYSLYWDLLRYFWANSYYNKSISEPVSIDTDELRNVLTNCPELNNAKQFESPDYINFLIEYFNMLFLLEKWATRLKLDKFCIFE